MSDIADVLNTIIEGDCIEVMRGLPKGCADLVVTSPPYWVGKSYEVGQPFAEYAGMMLRVYSECARLLKPAGYMVVNFGDMHNGGNRLYGAEVPSTYPATVEHWKWGREVGFDLQAARIWKKQFAKCGCSPVVNTRPRSVFEHEHIWTWRKRGNDGTEFCNDRRLSQRSVLGDGWSSSARLGEHEAAFPVELPEWAIRVYSRAWGDVVLDPFMGSGTTGEACIHLGRCFVGIERDPAHVELARRRLGQATASLFEEVPQ